MHVIKKDPNILKPSPINSRKHSADQIERIENSIREFGFTNPVLLSVDDVIIAGHARVEAAKNLKLGDVPCVYLTDLNADQIQAYLVADNRLAELSEWNTDILTAQLREIEQNFDLALIGWEDYEFPLDENYEAQDLDEIPDAAEPRVKLGDVWQLGDHRLMCGDSTNPLHVEQLLNDAVPNLMVTDPPYGVNYDPTWREGADLGIGKRSKGKVLNDDRIDWTDCYSLFPGNVCYIWHAGKYTDEVVISIKNCGYNIISQIIWAKQHFVLSRGDYHWQHEPCIYAVKKNHKHNWQGKRDQSTLWEINNNNSFGNRDCEETVGHGTQKPIECMLRPILNNSEDGEHIYDPFGGSGTTLIACEKSNRKCLMMELDPKYCDVIIARWEKMTGEIATLL